jgi:hypothetical protein
MAPVLTNGVKLFRSVEYGRGVVGADLLEINSAGGQSHVQVTFEEGRAVRVASIGPSGRETTVTSITYAPDGGQTRVHANAYGVTTYTDRLSPDGDRDRVERSGARNERGCARIHETYDARDLVAFATCFDIDGHLVTDTEGCAVRRYDYDRHLHMRWRRCFGPDGAPVEFRSGGHENRFDYDSRGLTAKMTRVMADGTFGEDASGCAATAFKRDRAGNVTLTTCLDGDGRARARSVTYIEYVQSAFDANGCALEITNLDAFKQPMDVLGVARSVYTRDAQCGELSLTQFDARGARANPPTAASSLTFVRNSSGLVAERRCYDPKGAPASCSDGRGAEGALVRISYDDRGRESQRLGFTVDGTPSRLARSYPHETRIVYGADDVSSVASYFDERGAPALANGTVASYATLRDRLGAISNVRSLDTNGDLVTPTTGCADLARKYDPTHRLATIECRDPDGALAASNLIVDGVTWPHASARVVVDREGNVVSGNSFFGTDGNLVKRVECGQARCYR